MSSTAYARWPKLRPPAYCFGLPVVRELDLRGAVAGRREENQRELALWVVVALDDFEAERVAVELQRGVDVGHAHHGVEIFHVSCTSVLIAAHRRFDVRRPVHGDGLELRIRVEPQDHAASWVPPSVSVFFSRT